MPLRWLRCGKSIWHIPHVHDDDLQPPSRYLPPASPYNDQGDMQEQQLDMGDEFMVYHDMLQSQGNFGAIGHGPATGVEAAAATQAAEAAAVQAAEGAAAAQAAETEAAA